MKSAFDSILEKLARLGYAAKGVVYATLGLLAAGARTAPDRKDAIAFLGSKPFGDLLLWAMTLGLFGYAAWRVVSGVLNSEKHSRDLKGVAVRTGSVIRGLVYGSFAFGVTRYLLHQGSAGKSSDETNRHWTARAMDHPFGRWAVALAGLAVIGYGAYQLYRAFTSKAADHLELRPTSMLVKISRFGIAARAVIFGVIGVSLIRAAITYNPDDARGTSGALRFIAGRPFGHWLLVVAGLGLLAYGAYAFINARYRRIAT